MKPTFAFKLTPEQQLEVKPIINQASIDYMTDGKQGLCLCQITTDLIFAKGIYIPHKYSERIKAIMDEWTKEQTATCADSQGKQTV